MPTEILMPALSPTMEEGKLAKWLVKEGQTIKAGDVIAEIETDKATMEVEATDEGKVGRLLVAEGTEGVKVNTPIATLLGEGETAGAAASPKAAAQSPRAPSPAKGPPPAAGAARAVSSSPPPRAEGAAPTRRGEGLGVGGTPTANVQRSPPPQPSPTRGEGVARAEQRRWRTGMGGSLPRRWRGGWPRRPASSWRRLRVRGRTGASSSATSRPRRRAGGPRRREPRSPRAPQAPSRRCRRAWGTTRSWRSTRRAPTRSCRTTACARSSPSA